MQGNIIGQSGMFVNDSLFPIYQQLNQPIEYNGIWIKTEDNLKDVYFQTDDVREYEFVNDLPFNFSGRTTSIGSDIYLFGGGDDEKSAYKYNSIEGTYTKLTNIPLSGSYFVTSVISNGTEIYIASGSDVGSGTKLYKYDPLQDTYTSLSSTSFIAADGGSLTILGDNLYMFGSKRNEDNQKAYKYNLNGGGFTALQDIPYSFNGSAIAINENEIALLGVYNNDITEDTGHLYIYNVTENEYYNKKSILGKVPSYTKINNFAYLIEEALAIYSYANFQLISSKYNMKNNSIYQYGNAINKDMLEANSYFAQVVNANNDLYILTETKIYKAKIIADYKGDGIYVISQTTSLSKDLDVSNILDVKKIVDGEEQDILVYIGDGESWKLLNGSYTTQTTNALQYALNFKEEN